MHAPSRNWPIVQIEEAGNEVRAWLEHVNEFLKDGQWKDAVETLRRVMENRGDRLIETSRRTRSGRRSVSRSSFR